MSQNSATRAARYRSAIVAGAIAVIVLCGGRASAWAATSGTPVVPAAASTAQGSANRETPSATTAPGLADKYAERGTSARNLENFKGGDVVIVSTTGVIVVLLLIIILLSL